MPTVSVIIPVYKVERYLDACVESVLCQTFTDIEVLLVDDGSPDGCPALCDAWAAKDPRVRVIHRPNGGAATARNTGLDAAAGDFIYFADGDDLLEPNAIEYLLRAQKVYGTDVVIGNMQFVDAENQPLDTPDFTIFTDTVRTADGIWQHYFALDERKIYYVVVWNKLYKRSLFRELRFRDGKRYEDQFFMADLLQRCDRIACLSYPGYRYVQHNASTMATAAQATHYLERPEYLLEWCRYFTWRGDYLRAEGLLNDAVENLSHTEYFDLTTPVQQARYHQLRHECADVYTEMAQYTGRDSMRLRAGLIHLGVPVYLAFLRGRRPAPPNEPVTPRRIIEKSLGVKLAAPTVSVIIPVYKVEPYLDACVASVAGQTFTDFEIILVDDGSPDNCPALCDAWLAKDPRVRVIHKENGGLSAARNSGIAEARGRFLTFVDSDDLLEPDTLRRVVEAQRAHQADMVIYNVLYVDEENRPMDHPDFTGFRDEVLDEDAVWERYFALGEQRIYYAIACNKLYRASMFDTLSFRPGKRYEDQFLMPDALSRSKIIACLGYQGYRYVQRKGSIMASGSSHNYLDRPEFLLEWTAYFTRRGDYLRAEGLLNDAISNLAEKEHFDLSTPAQQARYRTACRGCAAAYTMLARATGQGSMQLRATLLRISLPLYRAFLQHKT